MQNLRKTRRQNCAKLSYKNAQRIPQIRHRKKKQRHRFCRCCHCRRRLRLEHVSALDLLAVAGHGELLDVLGVLGGGHHHSHGGELAVDAGLLGESSDLAGNSLNALLGLNDGLNKKTKG